MKKTGVELHSVVCPGCGHKNKRFREYCEICSANMRGPVNASPAVWYRQKRTTLLPGVLMLIIMFLIIYIIFKSFKLI